MSVPSLAIHLDRSVNEAFKFNQETHVKPVLATLAQAYAHLLQFACLCRFSFFATIDTLRIATMFC